MPEGLDISYHYTPEKDCKYYRKEGGKEYCFISDRHRHLNKCKVCKFGHYCRWAMSRSAYDRYLQEQAEEYADVLHEAIMQATDEELEQYINQ